MFTFPMTNGRFKRKNRYPKDFLGGLISRYRFDESSGTLVEDDSGLPCGTDRSRILVKVAEAPIADAGPDMTVCANSVVSFDGCQRDFHGGC